MAFKPYEVVLLLLATIGPLKVTIVCLVFALLGEAFLKVFQVSIPAFQIGGGIIVLLHPPG
jgi:small neutral amino acid transporter SnatA (MarC family)